MSGDVIGRDRRYQSWKVFHETTKAIIENGDPLLFDLKRDLSRLYRVDLVGWPARKCIKQPCSIQGSSNFAREACMEIKNVLASVTGEQNTDTLDPKEAVRHYMNKPVKPIRKPEDLPNVPEIDGNFAVKFRSMAGKFSVIILLAKLTALGLSNSFTGKHCKVWYE